VRSSLGLEVALADLFAHPRLADFAQVLAQASASTLPKHRFEIERVRAVLHTHPGEETVVTGAASIALARPQAALKLFCLPYAGGSSATYLDWIRRLDTRIELVTIDPPGRGRRLLEPPLARIDALADSLVAEVLPLLDRPYALFGHSNGALVAFELARRLHELARPPALFFASAKAAPARIDEAEAWHLMSDCELLTALRESGYVSDRFANEPELVRLFLPMLRADLALSETYRYRTGPRLPCDLMMLAGTFDAAVKDADKVAWQAEFSGKADVQVIAGSHMFIEERPDDVVEVVNRVCAPLLRGQTGNVAETPTENRN
jgi:medium-chain acyl-[acyl-carrier-protein] hydrolase